MCTVGTCTQFLYLFHVNTSHGRSEFAGARPHDMDAALSHRWGDGHVSARLCALAGGLRNATRVSVGSKPMHVHLQQNDLLWPPTFSAPRAFCSALTKRVPDVVLVAFAADIFVGVRRTPNLSSCQFPDRLPSRRQRKSKFVGKPCF